MPTLFRLVIVLGVLVALAYAAMLAAVALLHPQPRQIEESITLPTRPGPPAGRPPSP